MKLKKKDEDGKNNMQKLN